MKHIKKLLALCLTLALVLSLAACGKQEEQPRGRLYIQYS